MGAGRETEKGTESESDCERGSPRAREHKREREWDVGGEGGGRVC
jgi:hypothetical protein